MRRFGDEGTGGQSFLEYEWKRGCTYRCLVHVRDDGDGMAVFTGYFHMPELGVWRQMGSFRINPGAHVAQLRGTYSFIEDWVGHGQARSGVYGPAWFKTEHGPWMSASGTVGTTAKMGAGGKNAATNNRYISKDGAHAGAVKIHSGGKATADLGLGPHTFEQEALCIPAILTDFPLPLADGSPAFA